MADQDRDERLKQSDILYEQYAKPLEREHWGEFIIISSDGQFVFGPNEMDVIDAGLARFGPGGFVFKIGPRAVGRLGGHIRLVDDFDREED